MSLLMDALRRAEAEKKEVAKLKAAEKPTEQPNSGPQDSSSASSDNEEDLGATIKLDRLPLPMAGSGDAVHPNRHASQLEDISSSIGDSLNDLSIDFESTSPRMRDADTQQREIAASSSNDASTATTESRSDGQDENKHIGADDEIKPTLTAQDEPYDFSIHADSPIGKPGEALELEPMDDPGITSAAPVPEAITARTRTLPSANKLAPDVADLQNSQANASTLAASSVDPLLVSLPGESTLETSTGQTAVSANTVFEAGSPGISRRIILWTLTLGVALFGLLAVTGVYYFQQSPTARTLPSPITSVELEKARLKQTVVAADAGLLARTPLSNAGDQVVTVDTQSADMAQPSEKESNTDASLAVEEKSTVLLDDANSSKQNEESRSLTATEDTGSINTADKPARPSANATPNVDTKRLKIARSLRGEQSNKHVVTAYSAYQAGDLEAAKGLYGKALAIRPQDVNALNGLAALALGENEIEQAHQLYSRVLKLEPNNPTASAALFQIEGGVGNRVTETQLKLMLDRDGDPGLINFALGNLYSRHERWNDAQLAFFEAVRHRPSNADYLFNLAVSLDQIGQRKPAMEYYQKALTAADNSTAGFNAADAIARIQAITQSASSSAP